MGTPSQESLGPILSNRFQSQAFRSPSVRMTVNRRRPGKHSLFRFTSGGECWRCAYWKPDAAFSRDARWPGAWDERIRHRFDCAWITLTLAATVTDWGCSDYSSA